MQFCLVFVRGIEKLLQRIQTKTVIDISYIYYRHGIHAFNTAPICHLFSSSFEGNPPGVLNRGNCTVEMSIQIGHRMASLSLADAEATTEKDV